jgi:serine/threonine-protein kinase RsbW
MGSSPFGSVTGVAYPDRAAHTVRSCRAPRVRRPVRQDARRVGDPAPSPAAVAAACFDAFAARDVERFLALVHEDVRWQPSSTLVAPRGDTTDAYVGHAGIRAWFDDVTTWIGYSVRTFGFEERGDRVLVVAVATLASDDAWLTRAVAFVFTVEGGRVAELRTFEREDEARRLVGLPPASARFADGAEIRGELELPPEPTRLGEIRAVLRDAAADAGLDDVATNDLLVAATEAASNAIAHGRAGGEGWIRVRWARERELLAVCVESPGAFVPPPRGAAAREDDHGRGIAVMRLLVDELVVEPRGDRTLVRLAKRLARAA